MPNPYKSLNDTQFWKKAVAEKTDQVIFPAQSKTFKLTLGQSVATAGSCFAQNVAKHLREKPEIKLIESETLTADDPVFSGRYGNIYTPRQMSQLFDECLTGRARANCAIQRNDGRYVDVYRPFMEKDGFETPKEVHDLRQAHITAIRPIFETPDVFVFTLGLTECWLDPETRDVFPVCPGIYSDEARAYTFQNLSVSDILKDMSNFIEQLTKVNPDVKILLTVSPVPLTASFSEDHILSATTYSKSVLRTACGELVAKYDNAYYFPSFEMVANPFTEGSAYASNLRSVRADAIATVMECFDANYLGAEPAETAIRKDNTGTPADEVEAESEDVVCDDVEIESSMGF